MADWLVEEGIGEHRAIRLDGGNIAQARLDWPGNLAAGQVEDAVLTSRRAGSARGTARFANGQEALVDRLPRDASEGAALRLEVTRPAMAERDRRKLAQARPTTLPLRPAPTLAESLRAEGCDVRVVRRFPDGDWDDLWLEAWSGSVNFDGGALGLFDTPAMTLIDVDGDGDGDGDGGPEQLALAAVKPLSRALQRFDLGGSIGVDFPTLQAKSQRRAVDEALEAALADWPHARTAMNGFGFVQVVARRARVPITARIAIARPAAAARRLLRQAEGVEGAGAVLLSCHPALTAHLHAGWLEELSRRTGKEVRTATDPGLALEAGHAQIVTR